MEGGIFCYLNTIEYYDHIAPLSELLNVPFYVCDDPMSFSLGKKYYPDIDIRELGLEQTTPANLVAKYDYMIFPSHVQREEEYLIAEGNKQGKRLCIMFCPHGFSDKTYYWSEYSEKDFVFVYGQNMFDIFKEIGIPLDPEKCIAVGNYRYEYYKKNREHQLSIVKEEFLEELDFSKKTLFYAPTWVDEGNSSTFFEGIQTVIEKLPKEYNLIVKPHPRILIRHAAQYYEILSRYAQMDRVVFVDEFPLIYPLLDLSDFYLGDMSSVGYDFLAFDKPLFFIDKPRESKFLERQKYLYRCGTSVELDELKHLYTIIEDSLSEDKEQFSGTRKEVYDYTFCEPRSNSSIQKEFETKTSQFLTSK